MYISGLPILKKSGVGSLIVEKINNVEQLTAIVFEQDTEGIQFNDIVILKGNLHVLRKYDNPHNRLQSILFVESIEKQSKGEEIKNTEQDIQGFKQFALRFTKEDNEEENDGSIIDELVSMTAPLTVGNELAKRALLIVAVNAGLPNDPTRCTIAHSFPCRLDRGSWSGKDPASVSNCRSSTGNSSGMQWVLL